MNGQAVQPDGLATPKAPYSPVVVTGDFVLTAGQVGFEHVIKVNAFLTDFANFPVFNAVYREYFQAPYPVRTTVQAGLAPGLHVEVEAIARKP